MQFCCIKKLLTVKYVSLPPLTSKDCINALEYSLKKKLSEDEAILAVETGGHPLTLFKLHNILNEQNTIISLDSIYQKLLSQINLRTNFR